MNKKPKDSIKLMHCKKREQDLLMGTLNEDYIKDIICSHFKIQYLNKTTFFHPMDFYCDDNYFEIKSRRITHDKYDTTMVGYDKIEWIRDNYFKIDAVYFVFVFTDGDYYYEYNPEDKFETTIGGRWDRGKVEKKLYYYIPTNKLIKF